MKRIAFGANEKSLVDLYRSGLPSGDSTGWPSVDRHYTVGPSQFTVVTGTPSHGKSQWLDALMCHLLHRAEDAQPWRFLVCSPENWPLQLHESKLIEQVVGKRFGSGYAGRMTEAEMLATAQDVMRGRIEFAELAEGETFADLLVGVRDFSETYKRDRCGIVLDPWNQLEHYRPHHMSETEYISEALSAAIRITRQTGAHLWIVAHPAKMYREKNGERPIPTPYDISGSGHWYNKADNCITIHRDVMAEPGNPVYGRVDVHVQKVRFRHIGRPGVISLWYDGSAGRYLETKADAGYARPLL